MTRNPSHASPPWSGPRKSRAAAPRMAHDYGLLATAAACPNTLRSELSRQRGFDDDYAERLMGSDAGRAFTDWFLQQPKDFVDGFRLDADRRMEERLQAEREKLCGSSESAAREIEALRNLGFGVTEKED